MAKEFESMNSIRIINDNFNTHQRQPLSKSIQVEADRGNRKHSLKQAGKITQIGFVKDLEKHKHTLNVPISGRLAN